jgi:hypothetical protein
MVVSRSKLLAVSLASAFLLVSMVPNAVAIPSWNKSCEKAYQDWQKKSGHKAFAMTSAGPRGQNCGSSWGAPSKEAAERDAIKGCKQGKWGIKSTCYIMESK